VKWRRAPLQTSTAFCSAAESARYWCSGVPAISGAIESRASGRKPAAWSDERISAIEASAAGAQIALMSIANRPLPYLASLSRQLAERQWLESRLTKLTRLVATESCTYGRVSV